MPDLKRTLLAATTVAVRLRSPTARRPGAGATEHPGDLGRRHRLVQHQRLQSRRDGLPDAEHRPDRKGGRAVHRLVRAAELHRRARRLPHRPVAGAHRSDQGRAAGGRARPQGGRPDDRRAAQEPRLHDRPVRQEPPGRPRRAHADQSRLRRVPRQPLPPERRGGAGESRLPEGPGLQGEVRPARRDQGDRQSGRHADDRGHRPADQEADGDGRRGGDRRGARFHRAGARRGQAVLPVVELHPHAHLDPPQARVPGRHRHRHLSRWHGRARRHGRRAARQARRTRHRRQHDRDVLDRQRRRGDELAGRRHARRSAARRTPSGKAATGSRP